MPEIHPNLKLLSNHSSSILNRCRRKFYFYKMMNQTPDIPIEGFEGAAAEKDIHLDFGDVLGKAVQEFWITDSIEKSYLCALRSWKRNLEDDDGSRQKKTFWHLLLALDKFIGFRRTELAQYDLVYIGEKPATELGYTVDCGDSFMYRGFLDALLRHKTTNALAVWEGKTTGNNRISEVSYKFSNQGLGYSVVVENVARSLGIESELPYKIIYGVYATGQMEWIQFPFNKSHTDRASWIRDILLDMKHIAESVEEDYWPRNGDACNDFFKPCTFFDICGMKLETLIGPVEKVPEKKDDLSRYSFHFSLEELIEAQLKKHGG